ncbi:uncharacterized protein LOC135174016 isoform X6 [Pogoniulus pusillus]|uniref:uncharacterized protein LOC135174016 isoform X6 n=1 Tax=Pogoniulus pusillus TaxID=488313 RepID=UPI0030B93A81
MPGLKSVTQEVARDYGDSFHRDFQFGHMDGNDHMNSLLMECQKGELLHLLLLCKLFCLSAEMFLPVSLAEKCLLFGLESRSQPPATHPLLTPTPETQSSTWHRRSLVLQSQLQALEYFASASSMGLDTNSRVDLTCD